MTESTMSAPAHAAPARVEARAPSWLVLGVVFGLLSAGAILLFGPIGVSTTYPRFVGALLDAADPAYAGSNPYLVKVGGLIKPETLLVVGLLIGGFLASRFGRRSAAPAVEMIHASEGTSARRYVDAFLGGVLIIFGARLAGGCTSGHIISGISQLAVSGVLFGAAVFATGILTARLLGGGR